MKDIDHKDLSISTYNTAGPWMANQSGVQILHVPSGIVVQYGEDRSAHRNKVRAMELLRTRLESWNGLPRPTVEFLQAQMATALKEAEECIKFYSHSGVKLTSAALAEWEKLK